MIIVESFCQCCEPLTENCMKVCSKSEGNIVIVTVLVLIECNVRGRFVQKLFTFTFPRPTLRPLPPFAGLWLQKLGQVFKGLILYMFGSILTCVHVCKIQLLPMYVSSTPREDSSLWGLLTTQWGDLENMKVQSSERISHWTNAHCTEDDTGQTPLWGTQKIYFQMLPQLFPTCKCSNIYHSPKFLRLHSIRMVHMVQNLVHLEHLTWIAVLI